MPQRLPQLWLRPLAGVCALGLSAQELDWGRALPPPLRQRYWQSRAALRQLVGRCLACAPEMVPLQSPPGGPPVLLGDAGCVSLSHSGPMLLLAWSPQPVGVDLERLDRPLEAAALARRFFPVEEWQELQHLGPEPMRRAVLRSWVLKEAAIKWRQRTLAAELRCWSYSPLRDELRHGTEGLMPCWRDGVACGWRWAAVGPGVDRLELNLQI